MEDRKSFFDLADEINVWTPTEEFLRDFDAFMRQSVLESRINEAKALKSASEIFIF